LSAALKGLPDLSPGRTAAFVLIVAVGLGCGHLLAGRIPEMAARRFVMWLAVLGAAAAVVTGVVALLTT
jgi:hypothetical protein